MLSPAQTIAADAAKPWYGQIFQCEPCANAIKSALAKAGYKGAVVKILTTFERSKKGKYNPLRCEGWEDPNEVISTHGDHCGVVVDGLYYDNLHHDGLPEQVWLPQFKGMFDFPAEIVETKEF